MSLFTALLRFSALCFGETLVVCCQSHHVTEKEERFRFVNALFRADEALNKISK